MPMDQKQCDPCRQRGVCDAECSSQEREGGAPAIHGSQYTVQSQHPPKPSSQPFTVVSFPSRLAEASCGEMPLSTSTDRLSISTGLESFGGAKERHDMPGDETHQSNSTPSSRYSTRFNSLYTSNKPTLTAPNLHFRVCLRDPPHFP